MSSISGAGDRIIEEGGPGHAGEEDSGGGRLGPAVHGAGVEDNTDPGSLRTEGSRSRQDQDHRLQHELDTRQHQHQAGPQHFQGRIITFNFTLEYNDSNITDLIRRIWQKII